MEEYCALCEEEILGGEVFYECRNPEDLRVWHEDCAPPELIVSDEIFVMD